MTLRIPGAVRALHPGSLTPSSRPHPGLLLRGSCRPEHVLCSFAHACGAVGVRPAGVPAMRPGRGPCVPSPVPLAAGPTVGDRVLKHCSQTSFCVPWTTEAEVVLQPDGALPHRGARPSCSVCPPVLPARLHCLKGPLFCLSTCPVICECSPHPHQETPLSWLSCVEIFLVTSLK